MSSLKALNRKYWIRVTIIIVLVVSGVIYCLKGLCQVPHIPLLPDRVKIVYGLRIFPENYREAWKTYFPNAKTEVFGGCVVMPESKKTAIVFYYPKCRKVKQDWEMQNKGIE